MWHCKCDCGNYVSVVGKDLRRGATQSCGCLQKEKTSKANSNNLIGQRYGKLVVVEQAPSKKQRTYWKCKCDCGNEVVVCARELSAGDTKSCGCLYSKGEHLIYTILTNANINFQKEFIFCDLKTNNNQPQRFDFAIFDKQNNLKCLIEYDGKQHFSSSGGWNSEENLKLTQQRDEEKNNYCKNNKIPLIRIPYTDYDKIDFKYLEERIEKECQCTVDTLLK